MDKPAGDSAEQRVAEGWLIQALSEKKGIRLTKKKLFLDQGSWIELDGFCESPPVLCEAWAHIGPPKSAQKHKVMTDAFKLLFVSKLIKEPASEKILLFADPDAAAHFQGKSWMAQCLLKHEITVEVLVPPADLRVIILRAQTRQYR